MCVRRALSSLASVKVIAEDLAPRQDDEEKEMRGPPATKAFDKDGKPTKVIITPHFTSLLNLLTFCSSHPD